MNVYAVDKGADFGTAIGESGVLSGNRFAFFACNASTNNPLGNGYIILIHSPNCNYKIIKCQPILTAFIVHLAVITVLPA